MKRLHKNTRVLHVFILPFFLVINSCDTNEKQTIETFTNLVWSDEFDIDGAIDATKWMHDLGDGTDNGLPAGWGNNELQFYTNRTENINVQDGMLEIIALRESFEGYGFTSAKILTKNLFESRFGRYEARIKLPWGKGLWPAFWLLGDDNNGAVIWPQVGEIDIMEFRGQQPTLTHGSIHGPGYSAANAITKSYELDNNRFDTSFHVFGIEWGPNFINYYVDDVLYNQITPADIPDGAEWVFNTNQFHIILNLAVGGNFLENPDENTVFPQTMFVDYVRVYK